MRKILSGTLAILLLMTIFSQTPPSSALPQLSIFTDKPVYTAGESVYVYGVVSGTLDNSSTVQITVTQPSGIEWSSLSLTPDPSGDFGATVGTVSPLDSTGTYLVNVNYRGLINRTTFQVRTPSNITIASDKLVYLVGETISVSGAVSPLIEGYRVTLRIGTNASCPIECEIAVGQITPNQDGTFSMNNFHQVRPTDNGHWFINATYGPFASTAIEVYVGLKITLFKDAASYPPEYVPGQLVNITGVVLPVVSGPLDIVVKNPSGGIWITTTVTPDAEGVFNVTEVAFPGDQTGNYSVTASYWGVNQNAIFRLGRLGTTTMSIATSGIFDINDQPAPWLYSGSTVRVRATMVNNDVVSHAFLFIIQIRDSSGDLFFIGCQSSSVDGGGFIGQTIGRSFTERDTYTVEIFVWDSWESANALSEVQTLTFSII